MPYFTLLCHKPDGEHEIETIQMFLGDFLAGTVDEALYAVAAECFWSDCCGPSNSYGARRQRGAILAASTAETIW